MANNFKLFIGRRKESVARARIYEGSVSGVVLNGEPIKKGEIFVNNKMAEDYFKGVSAKSSYEEPFRITNTLGKYSFTVRIDGGGQNGQLKAFIHAISRALSSLDEKNKQILKKKGFLAPQ